MLRGPQRLCCPNAAPEWAERRGAEAVDQAFTNPNNLNENIFLLGDGDINSCRPMILKAVISLETL